MDSAVAFARRTRTIAFAFADGRAALTVGTRAITFSAFTFTRWQGAVALAPFSFAAPFALARRQGTLALAAFTVAQHRRPAFATGCTQFRHFAPKLLQLAAHLAHKSRQFSHLALCSFRAPFAIGTWPIAFGSRPVAFASRGTRALGVGSRPIAFTRPITFAGTITFTRRQRPVAFAQRSEEHTSELQSQHLI